MGGEESLGPVLVDRHERAVGQAMPLELASDDPDAVSSWFRGKVSFPVAAPRFGRSDVRLLGARLTHVGADDAAYLAYRVQDHPLSVLVFPAGLRPAAGRDVRVVGDRRIYTSRRGGLAWVLFDSGGLTYALVSDLPEALLLELATRIR
jgi:anti-sigma factor RsiW